MTKGKIYPTNIYHYLLNAYIYKTQMLYIDKNNATIFWRFKKNDEISADSHIIFIFHNQF